MVKEIECIIHGRVQAVTFRAFAKVHADKFGIVGTAENMPDGSVRIVAQGDEKSLETFVEELRKGPEPARVTDIDVTERNERGQYPSFSIIYMM